MNDLGYFVNQLLSMLNYTVRVLKADFTDDKLQFSKTREPLKPTAFP